VAAHSTATRTIRGGRRHSRHNRLTQACHPGSRPSSTINWALSDPAFQVPQVVKDSDVVAGPRVKSSAKRSNCKTLWRIRTISAPVVPIGKEPAKDQLFAIARSGLRHRLLLSMAPGLQQDQGSLRSPPRSKRSPGTVFSSLLEELLHANAVSSCARSVSRHCRCRLLHSNAS